MPDPADATVRWEIADGVGTITLNRPESLNALNAPMRRELLAALKTAARDETVRAVMITGEGRGFCSGADLRGSEGERAFRRVLSDEYNPLIAAIRQLPKPVIAAVNGVAAGAGVSVAFACDLVHAAADARFVMAFGRIGLVPDSGLTRTLVRAIGRHRTAGLIFGGEPLGAAAAMELGLVHRVVPAAELRDTALAAARHLAEGPTTAIGFAKRLMHQAEQASLEDALALEAALQELAGRTDDHAEGLAAFAEKREPRFKGR